MSKARFRRFVLLDTENFKRLESNIILRDHLSETENKLLSIIKNNLIPIDKRLALYREVLFQSQARRRAAESQNSVEKKGNMNVETQTADEANHFDDKETKHIRQKTPEIFESQGDLTDDVFAKPTAPARRSLDFEQDLVGFDDNEIELWERERKSLTKALNESFGKNVDLDRLSYRGIDDPSSAVIVAEDKSSGKVVTIPKSKAIAQRQKEQAAARQQKIDNARRLSNSAPQKKKTRPANTPLVPTSPKKQKSGSPSALTRSGTIFRLANYEDIGKKHKISQLQAPTPMDMSIMTDDDDSNIV